MAPARAPLPGRSSPTSQRREQREALASKPKEATARGKASGLLGGGLPLNLGEASLTLAGGQVVLLDADLASRWRRVWPTAPRASGLRKLWRMALKQGPGWGQLEWRACVLPRSSSTINLTNN